MWVRDVMTRDPKTCGPETTLQDAASLMRDAGCGFLPVLDRGRMIGVLTDRDICIGLAERDRPASEIPVSDVMSWRAYFCNPNDRVSHALETMAVKQVRRLPVKDDEGRLCGVLSIDDVSPLPSDITSRDVRLRLAGTSPPLWGSSVPGRRGGPCGRPSLRHSFRDGSQRRSRRTLTSSSVVCGNSSYHSPTARKLSGWSGQTRRSARAAISGAVDRAATGTATTICAGRSCRREAIAAFIVAPVARPSSTRMAIRPATSSPICQCPRT